MKKILLFLLTFSMLLIVACSNQVPEDFNIELTILEGWSRPYYLSTYNNSYYKYNEQGERIENRLDLSENEAKELYKLMEEVWHYFPTSFDNKGDRIIDNSYFILKVEMNGQIKRIKWTGEDYQLDEIARILTNRVYEVVEIIDKRD